MSMYYGIFSVIREFKITDYTLYIEELLYGWTSHQRQQFLGSSSNEEEEHARRA